MKLNARRIMIKDLIMADGELNLVNLSQRFDVSEMTIRRDLEALEEQGVLRRVAGGGAISLVDKAKEPSFASRIHAASTGKAHIGQVVATRLSRHETVYFDGGSTALASARAVRGRGLKLTVLTPSLLVALELAEEPETTVFVLGGKLRSGEMLTLSPETSQDLNNFNVDTYVMGAAGVHPVKGITDYDPLEVALKKAAIKQADRVLLAIDMSKLDRVLLARIAGLEDIDLVVTDAPPNHSSIAAFPPDLEIVHVDMSLS